MRFAVLLLSLAGAADAVEIHLQFGALERMLSEQVFTQEGRRYVHGARDNKCNFAYLEKPEIRGSGGRLRIRAHFSGRSSLNLMGQCVGVGDAFDAVITARPVFKDGAIAFNDVRVTSDGKSGYYIRRVCSAMEFSLAHDFKYPLERDARLLLENPGNQPQYPRQVRRFNVPELRVSEDSLVLVVDFEMTIK